MYKNRQNSETLVFNKTTGTIFVNTPDVRIENKLKSYNCKKEKIQVFGRFVRNLGHLVFETAVCLKLKLFGNLSENG